MHDVDSAILVSHCLGLSGFTLSTLSASFAWFFALGYGARSLRGLFERPLAWKILDAIIALVMWAIAASLLLGR